jgi:hypothetical protein
MPIQARGHYFHSSSRLVRDIGKKLAPQGRQPDASETSGCGAPHD